MLKEIVNPHLYGLSREHLVAVDKFLLETETSIAFDQMRQAAAKDGLDITLCSGFRDFQRQLGIWNNKAQGNRILLDKNNHEINAKELNNDALIDTILLWSALPGASRHHWGTDIDIFDANQVNVSQLKLIDTEYAVGGPCYALSCWLAEHSAEFGFFRPYFANQSGVSPEPWHFSYYPVANEYLNQFSLKDFSRLIKSCEIQPKQAIVARLNELVQRYVLYVAPAPEALLASLQHSVTE